MLAHPLLNPGKRLMEAAFYRRSHPWIFIGDTAALARSWLPPRRPGAASRASDPLRYGETAGSTTLVLKAAEPFTRLQSQVTQNLRINVVCPESTDTPMMRVITSGMPEGEAAMIAQEAVGRMWGRPEEIEAVLWLCTLTSPPYVALIMVAALPASVTLLDRH